MLSDEISSILRQFFLQVDKALHTKRSKPRNLQDQMNALIKNVITELMPHLLPENVQELKYVIKHNIDLLYKYYPKALLEKDPLTFSILERWVESKSAAFNLAAGLARQPDSGLPNISCSRGMTPPEEEIAFLQELLLGDLAEFHSKDDLKKLLESFAWNLDDIIKLLPERVKLDLEGYCFNPDFSKGLSNFFEFVSTEVHFRFLKKVFPDKSALIIEYVCEHYSKWEKWSWKCGYPLKTPSPDFMGSIQDLTLLLQILEIPEGEKRRTLFHEFIVSIMIQRHRIFNRLVSSVEDMAGLGEAFSLLSDTLLEIFFESEGRSGSEYIRSIDDIERLKKAFPHHEDYFHHLAFTVLSSRLSGEQGSPQLEETSPSKVIPFRRRVEQNSYYKNLGCYLNPRQICNKVAPSWCVPIKQEKLSGALCALYDYWSVEGFPRKIIAVGSGACGMESLFAQMQPDNATFVEAYDIENSQRYFADNLRCSIISEGSDIFPEDCSEVVLCAFMPHNFLSFYLELFFKKGGSKMIVGVSETFFDRSMHLGFQPVGVDKEKNWPKLFKRFAPEQETVAAYAINISSDSYRQLLCPFFRNSGSYPLMGRYHFEFYGAFTGLEDYFRKQDLSFSIRQFSINEENLSVEMQEFSVNKNDPSVVEVGPGDGSDETGASSSSASAPDTLAQGLACSPWGIFARIQGGDKPRLPEGFLLL